MVGDGWLGALCSRGQGSGAGSCLEAGGKTVIAYPLCRGVRLSKIRGGQLANGYRGLRGRERGDGPLWRLTSDGRGTGPALERLAFLRSYLVDDLPPLPRGGR